MRTTEIASEKGGTPSGVSFIKAFDCKRRGYFSEVCKLQRETISPALALGTAVHDWFEKFYKGASDLLPSHLHLNTYDFPNDEDLADTYERGKRMLTAWYNAWADHDRTHLEVLSLERAYEYDLGDGFSLTVKPDVVVRDTRTGTVYALDHKTSRFKPNTLYPILEADIQPDAYILAMREAHENFLGWVPDIIYARGKQAEAARPGVIYRTEEQLNTFRIEAKAKLVDISDRVANIGNVDIRALFPRTTFFCHAYFRECPFLEICSKRVKPTDLPNGYKKKEEA